MSYFSNPFIPALNLLGLVAPAAKCYFYLTGTSTPATVYGDADLTTPLANPVVANINGRFPDIFLDDATVYRVRLETALGALIDEVDPFSTIGSDLARATGAGLVGFDEDATYPANTIGDYLTTYDNIPRSISYVGPFALRTLGTYPDTPAPGVYLGTGGNSLSFQTLVSYPTGGADVDNQRASLLLVAETTDDGNSEEQTLCILTTIKTGFAAPWGVSAVYGVGANVRANGNIYRCLTGGTSAASGTGPSGKGASISDGTVVWKWINDAAIEAKVGAYFETLVQAGAGASWGMANNVEIESGAAAIFMVGAEFDLTNNCGTDSTIGGRNKYNLYIQNNGGNVSTSVIDVGSSNSANVSAIWGLHFTGAKLASNSVIGIDASSAVGIGAGTGAGGGANPTFTDSFIKDGGSSAVKGITLSGAYSSAGVEINGVTPAALVITGVKSLSSIYDTATTPYGLQLAGTYAKSPIKTALLPSYADDAAASAGGLAVGDWYRTASAIKQRVA